jgi:hypothetical protein
VAGYLEQAREAFGAGAHTVAAASAAFALRLSDATDDPLTAVAVQASEGVLARILMSRIGSPARLLQVSDPRPEGVSLSAVFVHASIVDGMTVAALLEGTDSPRLEVLRALVELMEKGAVRVS